ncbi:MAG TPA: Rrf2 family transcriptional regulator [Acetobacteraceae bacterium]|nr:Rrf2 family transcriptional regulator [Acetobacteraceae bacterium]
MRLLASTDLALRVLMRLAAEPPDRRPLPVEVIASDLGGLSRHHLHKIVQDLAVLGAVRTRRGGSGGVSLALRPEQIGVGALIRQLEDDQPLVECFRVDGGCCTLRSGCRLRGLVRQAQDAFYRRLEGYTLADCLPETNDSAAAEA